jgi:Lon protease-like protein
MEELLLPLFPLEIVLLPEEPLPLHIFEERYKQMIGECLEAKDAGAGQQEFGVVLGKGKEICRVGCTARIINVTRKYADGRLDIFTVGNRRFEILFSNSDKPYLRGGVEYFDDESDSPGDAEAEQAIELFRLAMQRIHKSTEMPIHFSRPYRRLSFRMGASLPLDLEFKQQLLSRRIESERLQEVTQVMERLIARMDLLQKAQAKAGGNGDASGGS